MERSSNFQPNWASAPGDTIADVLNSRNLSLQDFAVKMDSSIDSIKGLLHGFVSINDEIAIKLEKTLGSSASFWLKREIQYRENIERLKSLEEKKLIDELPINDMVTFGWIDKTTDIIASCLNYFEVPDVWAWKRKYRDVASLTAFRKSFKIKSQPAAVAAWLRQGEIQSSLVDCEPWNPRLFKDALNKIRPLTKRKNPKLFLQELKAICAKCGVAVVIAPTPKGCAISGATKFISSNKALILLSFRYKSDDHFWFTFFHEAGHLLLHGNEQLRLETPDKENAITSLEEEEANTFASNVLIPGELKSRLLKMALTEGEIKEFAKDADISLGIIIGQLQHFGRIPYSHLNKYKRRYNWDDIFS